MKQLSLTSILLFFITSSFAQITDEFSLSSLFVIQVNNKGMPFGVASGFFMNVNEHLFFITNNHVITGDFAKDEHLKFTKTRTIPTDSTTSVLRIRTYSKNLNVGYFIPIDLSRPESTPLLMWEDAINKKGLMDVVAIPAPDSLKKYLDGTKILSTTNVLSDLLISPSSELFIVGFPSPYGQRDNEFYPIWKKGTIASEPDLGASYYWVDALGSGGMSGSPVYYRNQYYQTKSGNSTMQVGGTPTFLLGIYSAQNYGLNLGNIWKLDKVIEQIKLYRPK